MDKNKLKALYDIMKTMSVLYVEDDPDASEQMIDYLSELFGTTYHGKDGQEGLELFKKNKIDFIITDIIMPEMSGFEMIKLIQKIEPNLPVIVITAHKEHEYYEEAINTNVKGFISKPFSLNKLVNLFLQIVDSINVEHEKNEKLTYFKNVNSQLNQIGHKISTEKNSNNILETILQGAIQLSKADGGTLYLYNKQKDQLDFKITINHTLNMNYNSFNNTDHFNLEPLKFKDEHNTINDKNISIISAYEKRVLNLDNIYESDEFNFNGTKSFDEFYRYKTKSMLVVPLINIEDELFGVIQLVNKIQGNKVGKFNDEDELLLTSLSAIATITIYNNQLVLEMEELVKSIVKSIGQALNEKSDYTAKHVDNVAEIAETLANGINNDDTLFKNTLFTEDQIEEIRLAAWLHDIGKITTPENIIHKATRLEAIHDRIETIEARLEIFKRDIEIEFYKKNIDKNIKEKQILKIDKDIEFLRRINLGSSIVTSKDKKRLEKLAKNTFITIGIEDIPVINDNELHNLSIERGTLTKEEKSIIDNHVVVSYNMLKDINFPKKFKDVAKIAASHHKTLDNKGYCHEDIRNLEMSVQDKILAIADVFEALSAKDRPYKKPFKLSEISNILLELVSDNVLDKDIVKLFLSKKLYTNYVNNNFLDEQKDTIKIDFNSL